MQKWKNQLIFLGCVLVVTGCGKDNNSSIEASSSPRISALEVSKPKFDRTNSIAGIDADNNGVRDDIDAYINTQYQVASQKNAALQMARVIQKELLVSKTDESAIKLVLLAEDRAVNCIYLKFDRNGPLKPAAVVGNIEYLTSNTKERKLAYLAFSKAADGTTSSIPDGDTCD